MSIGDFIRSEFTTETDNLQTRVLSGLLEKSGRSTIEMLEIAKQNLESHFAVHGITEYFEDSILLIRDALQWSPSFHWSAQEISCDQKTPYFERTNVSILRPRREDQSQDDMDAIMSYTELDRDLYTHAKELFLQKVRLQPKSFKKEVLALKALSDANVQ